MSGTGVKKMVLGFVFNKDLSKVLLVNRQNAKQEWQNGKDNGLGGKVEGEETPLAAMVREFEEESEGIRIDNWIQFGSIGGEGWQVVLFCTTTDLIVNDFSKETREGLVRWCDTNQLPKTVIKNLLVLVPAAKHKLEHLNTNDTEIKLFIS